MCFKKKSERGGKELNYATFFLQPKRLCFTMTTFKMPASWQSSTSLTVFLAVMSSKEEEKKYPNRYSFHTFRCKLKTGPQQKSHGFIEIAHSEWGGKAETKPSLNPRQCHLQSFQRQVVCRPQPVCIVSLKIINREEDSEGEKVVPACLFYHSTHYLSVPFS